LYMPSVLNKLLIALVVSVTLLGTGCVSCIPQYTAPPEASPSACYPTGHDPYIPLDHNSSPLNPWNILGSLASPFLYGPPR